MSSTEISPSRQFDFFFPFFSLSLPSLVFGINSGITQEGAVGVAAGGSRVYLGYSSVSLSGLSLGRNYIGSSFDSLVSSNSFSGFSFHLWQTFWMG